jgi:hypothetical protein
MCKKLKILREAEQTGNHATVRESEVCESYICYKIAVTSRVFISKKSNGRTKVFLHI